MISHVAKWWRSAGVGLRTAAIVNVASQQPASQSYQYHTIEAVPRDTTGNKVSAIDRSQGRIPAVVFEQKFLGKVPGNRPEARRHLLTTKSKPIKAILESVGLPFFCSTTFPLQIRAGAGSSTLIESGIVLPITFSFVSQFLLAIDSKGRSDGKILNLVFVWADEGTKLKVDVPVVFKGEDVCPGLNKGGVLNRIRPSLRYLCPAEHIPSKIEVDVSNLDIGGRIFIRDIEVHPSMELLSKNTDALICNIKAKKSKEPEPAVTETELTDSDPTVGIGG